MHPFRAAVEAEDIDALSALMSEDVELWSPATFKPFRGRAAATAVLTAAFEVFEDFRYVREIGADDSPDRALVFRARVGDRELEGCDFLHCDESGAVDELVVMVRPLSGLHALAEGMRAQLAATDAG